MTRSLFATFHPVVLLVYLCTALAFAMALFEPFYTLCSLCIGTLYAVRLSGAHALCRSLRTLWPMLLLVVLINPLFNHRGLMVLCTLFDNPVTLEALLYGLHMGGMLLSVWVWFACYSTLMTTERFLYLFGRILPTLALVVSMILRWIPQAQHKARCVLCARSGLVPNPTRREQFTGRVRMSSALLSWCMEDGILTADAMRARGYGARKRTSYAPFSFTAADGCLLALLLALLGAHIALLCTVPPRFCYFPFLQPLSGAWYAYALYALLLALPLLIDMWEVIRWR